MRGKPLSLFLCTVIALWMTVFPGCRQDASGRKEDARYLIAMLEENFAYEDLYPTRSGRDFKASASQFLKNIDGAAGDEDFVLAVQGFLTSLRSPHTGLYFGGTTGPGAIADGPEGPLTPELYQEDMEAWREIRARCARSARLSTQYIEGRYIVTGSDVPSIPAGSGISRLNGIAVDRFVREGVSLYPIAFYDARREKLYTDDLFTLYSATPLVLDVTLETGETIQVPLDQPVRARQNRADWTKTVALGEERVVYTRLASMYDIQETVRAADEARTADAFVIDLRGNTGGYAMNAEKLATLIAKEGTVKENGIFFMKQKLWDDSIAGVQRVDTGPSHPLDMDRYAAFSRLRSFGASGWSGTPVYVLTDPYNYSAADYFLQLVKAGGLGTIVGVPSSGGMGSIAFDIPRKLFYLPNSRLLVSIEYCGYLNADQSFSYDWGTDPDVFAEQSLNDTLSYINSGEEAFYGSDYDTVFQACLAEIAKREKNEIL